MGTQLAVCCGSRLSFDIIQCIATISMISSALIFGKLASDPVLDKNTQQRPVNVMSL